MKIVIDIPEELYKRVKTKCIPLPHDFADVMDKAINNGTIVEAIKALEDERPQGELANEVWKLYKKHQSHLATYVYEFGIELQGLLGRYGGRE